MDFAMLLTTINPLSAVPWYLGLTEGIQQQERLRILRKATIVSFFILLGFLMVGEIALKLLGVSVDGFRLGGGLVLLIVGLKLVFSDVDLSRDPEEERKFRGDIAVFPMAMPYIAGPAAMTAIVLLTENDKHDLVEQAGTAATMTLVLVITYLILRVADNAHRILGTTGIEVMSRISGIVLSAIATQVIATGAIDLFPGLSLKAPLQ
jgi:multiple antibiotic resistance protein